MKYLKENNFEKIENNMTFIEYLNFTKKEISSIINILFTTIKMDVITKQEITIIGKSINIHYNNNKSILIRKTIDDYYILRFYQGKSNYNYYKCDQLNGLKSCLNYLIIIK